MNEQELRFRHQEINAAVAWLAEHGWRLEKILVKEEDGEPFAAEITVSFDPPSEDIGFSGAL